jgi:membrane protease YdiL (CAAX protease family)
VIAAPVTEELLFRGLLFGGLAPSALGAFGAAIVTSLVWAAIHIQYDLFDMGTIFLAGLLLAAARHSTQSVILCIILHSAMNFVATVEALVALRME